MAIVGHECKCYICKKEFIKHEDWAYTKYIGKRGRFFCSWKCLREWEHSRGTSAERRERIIRAIKDGLTNREIVALLGEENSRIDYWRKKTEEEKRNGKQENS